MNSKQNCKYSVESFKQVYFVIYTKIQLPLFRLLVHNNNNNNNNNNYCLI